MSNVSNRLYLGNAWMMCQQCNAKLWDFDGFEDKIRDCPYPKECNVTIRNMSTQNLPATVNGDAQWAAWKQLVSAKNNTTEQLQTLELESQKLLLGYDTMQPKQLEEALDLYKKKVTELGELRKGFTVHLDGIKTKMMVFEKRAESWETFVAASKRLLELKKELEAKAKADAAKNEEKARFEAFVKNEYLAIASEYEIALKKEVANIYTYALNDELEEEGIKKVIEVGIEALARVNVRAMNKFTPTVCSKEDLTEVFKKATVPNYAQKFEAAKESLVEKFKMYHQDKQNAEAAKNFIAQEAQEEVRKVEEQQVAQTSVNNLVAQAVSTPTVEAGLKAIKKKLEIVEEDTPQWAVLIMGAFISNLGAAAACVRVKKIASLTVGQMAKALTEAEIKVDGVQYREVEK